MTVHPSPDAKLSGARPQRRVWVLLGGKQGDNDQLRALSEALGWPLEEKNLAYNGLYHSPNILLGATLRSLTPAARGQFRAPWPELVIAAGRRAAPVARWVRRQSGGKTRLVHIGRPRAPLDWFDLMVTTPQYGLPPRDNLLHLALPLQNPSEDEVAFPEDWDAKTAALPRPWTAVLVGGSTWPFLLEAAAAQSLAEDLNRWLAVNQGSALITTSPRSAPLVAETLEHSLACPHLLHAWRPGTANPYRSILAAADRVLVTSDSVSMLAEACRSGKPVAVWRVPQRQDPWSRLKLMLGRQAGNQGALGGLLGWSTVRGLFWPPRSVAGFTENLVAAGRASWFDPGNAFGPGAAMGSPDEDLSNVVDRVWALFED